MNTKILLLALLLDAYTSPLISQQRVLLHVNENGVQEAIPLRSGERTEQFRSSPERKSLGARPSGVRDSLVNFGPNASTNFVTFHQDVLFQWFDPEAGGFVREFGWKNGPEIGTIPKSTIRAWNADKQLLTLPRPCNDCQSSLKGYYKKSDDGDGLKTPFKDEATDTIYVGGKFDPLGTEAAWLKKGQQFALVPSSWQSFKLLEYGDTMKFNAHELIGFTKQNDAKINDIG